MRLFVRGEPITKKSGPSGKGYDRWKDDLRSALDSLLTVSRTCRVRLTFLLPMGSVQPANLQNRYGGDLDNLSGTVLDALAETVLKPAGGDGAVRELFAVKRPVRQHEVPGVWISITGDS